MPEEVEVETKDLQETIDELREEREEREEEERKSSWTRWISLTTALLAVFAAIGALQSGALVNGAMLDQLRASDTWNEYQASRLKEHLYTIEANTLLDRGEKPAEKKPAKDEKAHSSSKEASPTASHKDAKPGHGEKPSHGKEAKAEAAPKRDRSWKALPLSARLAKYIAKVEEESSKQEAKMEDAKKLEEESQHKMHRHHGFANSVAFIQVAIALSAVAALTKMKSVWFLSLGAGALGIYQFILGWPG